MKATIAICLLAAALTARVGSAILSAATPGAQTPAAQTPAAQTPAAQPAPPPTIADGLIPLMTISSELLSAQVDAVSADQFEVPANFKLAK